MTEKKPQRRRPRSSGIDLQEWTEAWMGRKVLAGGQLSGPALEPLGLFATEITDTLKFGGVTRESPTAELVAALLELHKIELADDEELVCRRGTYWAGDEDMG